MPRPPALHEVIGEPLLGQAAGRQTERDVFFELWLVREQFSDHAAPHHLFVYGVRLDVLPVERDTVRARAQSLERAGEPVGTGR